MPHDDYERLVIPIQERMVNAVWRIVQDMHETEDVVQEALVQIMHRFSEVRRHPNPTALMLRICSNKALDHVRSRKSRRDTLDRLPPAPQHDAATPSQALAHAEDRILILDFLQTLPEREAEAITLYALEDLDYAAVAEAMGCFQVTVRVLIGRARRRFRKEFGANPSARSFGSRISQPAGECYEKRRS